jgi:hypothetical protein
MKPVFQMLYITYFMIFNKIIYIFYKEVGEMHDMNMAIFIS